MNRVKQGMRRGRGLTLLELLIVMTILVALGTLVIPTMGYLGRRSQSLAARENLYRLQELIVNRYWAEMGELPRPAVDDQGAVIDPPGGGDVRVDHPQLRYLFVNPDRAADANDPFPFERSPRLLSGRTWQGPYLSHSGARYQITDDESEEGTGTGFTRRYGETGDPTVLDAWGRPIVLQLPQGEPDDFSEMPDPQQRRIRRLHTRLVSAGPSGRLNTPPDVLMPSENERGDDVVLFLFRYDEQGPDFLTLEDD